MLTLKPSSGRGDAVGRGESACTAEFEASEICALPCARDSRFAARDVPIGHERRRVGSAFLFFMKNFILQEENVKHAQILGGGIVRVTD